MKCQLCQKELEAYRVGLLPEGTRAGVKAHLEACSECAAVYQLETLSNRVVEDEKALQSNPFLATRIMAGIEALEQKSESYEAIPAYRRVLKPVIIGVSIAAAVMFGIFAGNAYSPNVQSTGIPQELAYINDANIEAIAMLTNE